MVPGTATAQRGAPNPVPACWHGGCGVWVMPGVWGLLQTPPSGTAQARNTAPARSALAVPGRAPVSPVAPTGPGSSLLGEEPTLGQAGARGAQEHLRNSSTASAFPKPIHCPASEPFQTHPSAGHRRLSSRGTEHSSTSHIPRAPGQGSPCPPAHWDPLGSPSLLPLGTGPALAQPWHSITQHRTAKPLEGRGRGEASGAGTGTQRGKASAESLAQPSPEELQCH